MDAEFEIRNDNSDEIIRAMQNAIPPLLEVCGLVAENYSKRLCPVDTGRLRNSITHATKQEQEWYAVYIGTNVEYAPKQEFGDYTHKVGQSPYLRPAIADHIDQYKEILENGLKNIDI